MLTEADLFPNMRHVERDDWQRSPLHMRIVLRNSQEPLTYQRLLAVFANTHLGTDSDVDDASDIILGRF